MNFYSINPQLTVLVNWTDDSKKICVYIYYFVRMGFVSWQVQSSPRCSSGDQDSTLEILEFYTGNNTIKRRITNELKIYFCKFRLVCIIYICICMYNIHI